MTKRSSFKRLARHRMAVTGQSYTAAAADVTARLGNDGRTGSRGLELRIVFVGWQDGRGTSTLALYTAHALAEQGLRVALVDCHPLGNLIDLCRAVPDVPFDVTWLPVSAMTYLADVVVVDSPALGGPSAEIAYGCVRYADEVVVPVPIAARETRAVLPIAARLRPVRPELRSCAVLWGGRANSRSTPIARSFLEARGFDVLEPVVYLRDAYANLTALLAHVDNDGFPAIADMLINRHDHSSERPSGRSLRVRARHDARRPCRKPTRLTPRERREHSVRLRQAIWSPRARRAVVAGLAETVEQLSGRPESGHGPATANTRADIPSRWSGSAVPWRERNRAGSGLPVEPSS